MTESNKRSEKEYFREKEDFVLGFISEEHLIHYLNYMFYGRSMRSINKVLYFNSEKQYSADIDNGFSIPYHENNGNYTELFFKEFYCKEDILPSVLEKEAFRWGEWIEGNSEFHVVFAVLAKDAFTNKSECYFLLQEDREREDFLR